jgi:hypothetical protein
MDSLVMIQPSLICYSFQGPPAPVLLDSSSLAPVWSDPSVKPGSDSNVIAPRFFWYIFVLETRLLASYQLTQCARCGALLVSALGAVQFAANW